MTGNSISDSHKIIGGEFAIAPDVLKGALDACGRLDKTPFSKAAAASLDDLYDNVMFFSSARAALYAALCVEKTEAKLHVYLPDYLCSSVLDAVNDAGLSYSFYHIEDDLYPDMDSLFDSIYVKKESVKNAVILINYFGLLDLEKTIKEIRKKAPKTLIMLDDVQNYYGFGTEPDYDYAFTSLRKWFPIPDGGLLKIADSMMQSGTGTRIRNIYDSMKDNNLFVSYKLSGNVLKSYRGVIDDSICLELIEKGEGLLDKNYKCPISDISYEFFNSYILKEQESASNKRKDNARILHEGLEKLSIKHIYNDSKVPLFIPVFLDSNKRDVIRKKMFDNNIFCPVHWKNSNALPNPLYDMELSLICDQRYDKEDMNAILNLLT